MDSQTAVAIPKRAHKRKHARAVTEAPSDEAALDVVIESDNNEAPTQKRQRTKKPVEIPDVLTPRAFASLTLPAMKVFVPKQTDYKTLGKFLKVAKAIYAQSQTSTNRSKVLIVERRMKELIAAGEAKKKRRVPGTGNKIEEIRTYPDTEENRAKNRVGKQYKVTKWVDCTYEDVKVERLIRKRLNRAHKEGEESQAPKRKNTLWIESVRKARETLGLNNKFIPIQKALTENATEEQKLGVKLYEMATKYKEQALRELAEAMNTA